MARAQKELKSSSVRQRQDARTSKAETSQDHYHSTSICIWKSKGKRKQNRLVSREKIYNKEHRTGKKLMQEKLRETANQCEGGSSPIVLTQFGSRDQLLRMSKEILPDAKLELDKHIFESVELK